MGRRPLRFAYILALALLLLGGAAARRLAPFDETNEPYREINDRITTCLMKGLVFERPLPPDNAGDLRVGSSVAYILGGTQESLRYKCTTAGRLYAEGAVAKILALHRPGITEYSPALGRNFTNDEWATGKLKEEGVAAENVEFVPVPPASFDTFAEARVVSALARSRRVQRLVLVSSSHHTRRVWLSFSHFNADNAFASYTCVSKEHAGISELLLEHLKLQVYRYIVLPLARLRSHLVKAPNQRSAID
jgi:uncharacterized SAM-binding protein YcdF (DUF218 family)